MLDFHRQGKISIERIVEKMCHAPAICFKIDKRGFLREGYWADIAIVDLEKKFEVTQENIYYKCGWSPFEGHTFNSSVTETIVSGHIAFDNGTFNEKLKGKRLNFNR